MSGMYVPGILSAAQFAAFGGSETASSLLGQEPQGFAVDFLKMNAVVRRNYGEQFVGDPNDLITYTGVSAKQVMGSDGFYHSGSNLRTSYDRVTGNPQGLLIESASTNLVTYSTDFSQWGNYATFSPEDAISIFDGQVAKKLTGNGTNAQRLRSNFYTLTVNTPYIISAIVEQVIGSTFLIGFYNSSSTWSNGFGFVYYYHATEGTTSSGTPTNILVEPMGIGPNGGKLARISFTCTPTSVSGNSSIYLYPNGISSTTNSTIVHHVGVETISGARSSPIVTGATSVVRTADAPYINLSQLPWDTNKGTWLFEAVATNSNVTAVSNGTIGGSSVSNTPRIQISLSNTAATIGYRVVPPFNLDKYSKTVSIDVQQPSKFVMAYDGTTLKSAVNGSDVDTFSMNLRMDQSAFSRVFLGSIYSSISNLYLRKVVFIPRMLSDAEMQAWSAGTLFSPQKFPDWLLFGPDGSYPVRQSEWDKNKGWANNREFLSANEYIQGSNINYARNSIATYYDVAGILKTGTANTIRLDYDPYTNKSLGYRVEGERTNILLQSNNFTVSPWNNYNASILTSGFDIGPDGTMSLTKIEDNPNTVLAQNLLQFHYNITISTKISTFSLHIKRYSGTTVQISHWNNTQGNEGTTGNYINVVDQLPIGNLKRVSYTHTMSSSSPTIIGSGVNYQVGPNNDRVLGLFGAQIDPNSTFPSSYIPTTSSAVTRNADSLSYQHTSYGLNTVIIKGRTPLGVGTTNQTLYAYSDNTTNNSISIIRAPDRKLKFVVVLAGSTVVNLELGTVLDDLDFKVAVSYKQGIIVASLNGETPIISTTYSGLLPDVTTVKEGGSTVAGEEFFGTLKSTAIFNRFYDQDNIRFGIYKGLEDDPLYDELIVAPDGRLPVQASLWDIGKGFYGDFYDYKDYIRAANGIFQRLSNATYFDYSGIMRTATSGELRLEYSMTTGESLGFKIEGSRTNSYIYGSNFPVSTNNTGVTSANGVAIAPNGAMEAIRIIPNATGNTVSRFKNDTRMLPEGITAHSVFFKAEAYPRLALRVGNGSTYALFNDDYINDSRVSNPLRGILPNGWGRYSAVRESINTSTVRGVGCHPAGSGDITSFNGDGSSGSLFWGWQMEVGGFPSSYIPTNGSSVIRYADSLSYAIIVTSEGTVVISARTPLGADGNQTLWCWDDGTTANRLRLVRDSSRHIRLIVTVFGTDVVNLDIGTVADDTTFKVAASWKVGQFVASLNGGTPVIDTSYSGPLPVVTTLREGSSSAGEEWFGTIGEHTRFDKVYAGAELQEIIPWYFEEDLFRNNEAGVLYDFSDRSTLFQNANGTIPVIGDNQPVGLVLDKHSWHGLTLDQVIARQLELNNPSSRTLATISGGTAVEDPVGTISLTGSGEAESAVADQFFTTVVGQTYRLVADVNTNSTGLKIGSTQNGTQILNTTAFGTGTQVVYMFRATATTTWIRWYKTATNTTVISNISIKQIPGNHAYQATAGSRPMYRTNGKYHKLKFDGVDDFLSFGNIGWDGTGDYTFICGSRISDTYTTNSGFINFGNSGVATSYPGMSILLRGTSSSPTRSIQRFTTTSSTVISASGPGNSYPIGENTVLSVNRSRSIRINGNTVSLSGNDAIDFTGYNSSYNRIGSSYTYQNTNAFNGEMSFLLLRVAPTSDIILKAIEKRIARKMEGVTIT